MIAGTAVSILEVEKMKVTKFSKSVNETLDSSKLYSLEEAFNMLMSFKRESFNESVDVALTWG